VGVHSATVPVGGNELSAKLEGCRAVMNAPWPPLRRPYRTYHARQVSWLTAYRRRRLPRPMKSPVARNASTRRLQSRGRPRIDDKAYRVPFSPSGVTEGPCAVMFQLREGLSNGARRACATLWSRRSAPPTARTLRRGRLQTSKKIGPNFGGQLCERFGGRTSRPERRSELPQRCNFGFRQDRPPGRDGALSLR